MNNFYIHKLKEMELPIYKTICSYFQKLEFWVCAATS